VGNRYPARDREKAQQRRPFPGRYTNRRRIIGRCIGSGKVSSKSQGFASTTKLRLKSGTQFSLHEPSDVFDVASVRFRKFAAQPIAARHPGFMKASVADLSLDTGKGIEMATATLTFVDLTGIGRHKSTSDVIPCRGVGEDKTNEAVLMRKVFFATPAIVLAPLVAAYHKLTSRLDLKAKVLSRPPCMTTQGPDPKKRKSSALRSLFNWSFGRFAASASAVAGHSSVVFSRLLLCSIYRST